MADTKETTQDKKQSAAENGAVKTKTLWGVVVSNKMKDTIVVETSNYAKHPRYGKFVKTRKLHKAHDAGNTKQVGEKVQIEKVRPISKDKHFRVVNS